MLGLLLAVGTLSIGIAAFQQPPGGAQPAPRVVQVDQVKDNLYVLRGGGGNTAVFVGQDGVVVVDSKNPGWGQSLLDKIRELTNKPVTTLINTHSHYDHVSGNVEFPANVDVVTHENTKSNMEKVVPVTGIALDQQPLNVFKDNSRGLPKRTFKDRLTLGRGNDRIELFYFGRGHTNGDTWVLFPALRVVHAGDIFAGKGLPLLDVNNGGSGVGIPETLGKAASTFTNDVDQIITGHSPALMTINDLREFADFNREFLMVVQEAKKAGRSVDEVVKSWTMPAKYTGYNAPAQARLRGNVEAIFYEMR